MKKININSLMALIFVGILAISAYYFQESIKVNLKLVLVQGYLKAILILFVSIVILTHSLKVTSAESDSLVMYRSGFKPLDVVLTLGTYLAITSTACSLLEGAYLQQFFQIEYFKKFEQLDIYTLLGVSALLLWYVVFHMYKLLKEFLLISDDVSIVPEKQQISE